jgi:CheY-like chemotaxis protein
MRAVDSPSAATSARVLVVDDSPTIRKVVSAILTRHGYEAVQANDGEHALSVLAESERFDLALVDFVMPKMTGFEFCKRVRDDDGLRELPVILMSAKTDKIREQFVQQTGALDAITKPFDARALVAMVEATLDKIRRGRHVRTPSLVDEIEAEPDEPSGEVPSVNASLSVSSLAMMVSDEVATAVTALPEKDRARREAIAAAVSAVMGTERIRRALASGAPAPPLGGRQVLQGSADAIPLGEIFQVLQMQRQTGVLVVRQDHREVSILFRDGNIDLAQSKNMSGEFRLGRYFIEEKLISKEKLDSVVRDHSTRQQPLGALLIDLELVTAEQLEHALMRQSSELIYEVCRWPAATYAFYRDADMPLGATTQLGLPPASLVMEGFRRVDEWRLVEEQIDFDSVLMRDAAVIDKMGSKKLSPFERNLLEVIDGERTVSEIVALSNASSFDACRTLYQFIQSRIVRRRAA